MTEVARSVSLMLIRGQLVQGHAIERNTAIVVATADDAWAQLLTAGECYLAQDMEQLQALRTMYTGWVMDGAKVTDGVES